MKLIFTKTIAWFCVLACLTGCASSYHAISPETVQYGPKTESNGVVLLYKYNVLQEKKNKKYAKKETNNNMQLVAVKITNNTENIINLNNDLQLFVGEKQLTPAPADYVHSSLKQTVPLYLLYLLFTPMNIYTTSTENGQVKQTGSFPAGLILGPGLTLINVITASNANKAFMKDLQTYSLEGKVLQPGETAYALVGINHSGYSPIYLKSNMEVQEVKR